MIDTFNGALLLNQRLFQTMREAPDVVRRGLLVVLLVGLLVGGVNGANIFLAILDPARAIGPQRAALEQQADSLTSAVAQPGLAELTQDSVFLTLTQFDITERVTALPTALPRPVGAFLSALAVLVNTPVAYLGWVLLITALAHAAARQLGGVGSLQQTVGLGALSAAPHALDALAFLPGLGPTLGLLAWGWGLLILITAVGVAHRLDSGKATIAAVLYPTVFGGLGFVALCGLAFISGAVGAAV